MADTRELNPDLVRVLLEEGVDFEITRKDETLLTKLHIQKKSVKFVIFPATLGTLFLISKILSTIDEIDISSVSENIFSSGVKNIVKSKNKLIDVVVIGILGNRCRGISGRVRAFFLRRLINDNLTPREMLVLCQLVVQQMDVTDFLASTVLMRKMNLTKTAKAAETPQSTIGKSSEE